MNQKPVLILGATGYIGSRLVPLLLNHGYHVRVGYRSLNKLQERTWSKHPRVFPFKLDVFDKNSLEKAMNGCSIVYYLVHSMESSVKDFVKKDKIAAQNTVLVAERTNIKRIIYLGGLGEEQKDQKLSKHLESRIEVAKILNSCSIPVTTLRAAIIIGTGSAAFEMMRYLTDRLPIMITPRWLRTKNQPIAVRNVLIYLLKLLDNPETIGETYDIGGPDIITYKQFMESYVEITQLPRRIILPIPIFSPRISSYWIKFITGISSALARPLINGMKNEVIVKDTRIQKIIPQRLIGHKEAIYRALNPRQFQELTYNQKSVIPPEWYYPGDSMWSGGMIFQVHKSIIIPSPRQKNFYSIRKKISGWGGNIYINSYYTLGSFFNQLFHGKIQFSKNLWKAIKKRNKQEIQFVSSSIFPGKTFLTYKMREMGEQSVQLHQIYRIIPKGMLGTIYWLLISPFFNQFSKKLLVEIANSFNGYKHDKVQHFQTYSKPTFCYLNNGEISD